MLADKLLHVLVLADKFLYVLVLADRFLSANTDTYNANAAPPQSSGLSALTGFRPDWRKYAGR